MFRALCAHHQEVKIVLYGVWYHHTQQLAWQQRRAGICRVSRQMPARRPWGPPSLLYNGNRVIPGVKAVGVWR